MALEPQDREPSVVNKNELPDAVLKRVLKDGTSVTSANSTFGVAQLTGMSSVFTGVEYRAVIDPQNPNVMLTVGGATSGGGVFGYNIKYDSWVDLDTESARYAPISINAADISTGENYNGHGLATTGKYVVAAGGENTTTSTTLNSIYVLDTEAGSWSELNSTLPAAVNRNPLTVPDPNNSNSVLVFGGFDGSTVVDNAVRVDVENDTVTNLTALPNGGCASFAYGSPIVNDKVFITGNWGNAGTYSTASEPFYMYDVTNDTYTPLSATSNAVQFADGTSAGLNDGVIFPVTEDILVAFDGFGFHGKYDHAYYDRETDTWASREVEAPPGSDFSNYAGTKRAVMTDNGVIYGGGTGNDNGGAWAYIPETEPPEFQ